jgi:hypothetical protein
VRMAQRLRVNSFTTLFNPEPLFRRLSRRPVATPVHSTALEPQVDRSGPVLPPWCANPKEKTADLSSSHQLFI